MISYDELKEEEEFEHLLDCLDENRIQIKCNLCGEATEFDFDCFEFKCWFCENKLENPLDYYADTLGIFD